MVREIRTIVHETGPDISMEEIAVGLGTSKSVLYRYFGDKNGLQAALGNYTLARTRRQLAEAAASHNDAELAMRSMLRTYLEIVARSRNVFLFVNRPSGRGPLQSFIDQVEEMVAGIFSMDAHDADPERLQLWASASVGLVRAAAERWADTPPSSRLPIDQLTDDLSTMLWRGTTTLFTSAH